ncbi:hypothetical protein BGZ51_002844 [Haplosporangium sp. Z 767]|nr:hypothetical protein BGZ51_002844 [Haplosporangium sp. Z 767]
MAQVLQQDQLNGVQGVFNPENYPLKEDGDQKRRTLCRVLIWLHDMYKSFLRETNFTFVPVKKQHIVDLLLLFTSKAQAVVFNNKWTSITKTELARYQVNKQNLAKRYCSITMQIPHSQDRPQKMAQISQDYRAQDAAIQATIDEVAFRITSLTTALENMNSDPKPHPELASTRSSSPQADEQEDDDDDDQPATPDVIDQPEPDNDLPDIPPVVPQRVPRRTPDPPFPNLPPAEGQGEEPPYHGRRGDDFPWEDYFDFDAAEADFEVAPDDSNKRINCSPSYRPPSQYILPSVVAPKTMTNMQRLWTTEGPRNKPRIFRETHLSTTDPIYKATKETLLMQVAAGKYVDKSTKKLDFNRIPPLVFTDALVLDFKFPKTDLDTLTFDFIKQVVLPVKTDEFAGMNTHAANRTPGSNRNHNMTYSALAMQVAQLQAEVEVAKQTRQIDTIGQIKVQRTTDDLNNMEVETSSFLYTGAINISTLSGPICFNAFRGAEEGDDRISISVNIKGQRYTVLLDSEAQISAIKENVTADLNI